MRAGGSALTLMEYRRGPIEKVRHGPEEREAVGAGAARRLAGGGTPRQDREVGSRDRWPGCRISRRRKGSGELAGDAEFSIYDAAGPIIEGAGTLGIDMEADTSGISFEAYLEGKIAIGVQLKVPVIDEVLLEATIAEFESKRWSLIKWSTTWDNVFNGSDPSDGGDETEEGGVSDPNMPRPNPAPEFDASDLRITLYWNNKSDMDIHVVEPDGSRIWYNNRGPTASQGTLDIDSNSNCNVDRPNEPGGIENVYWPNGVAAPTGDYSISVDRYSGCRLPDAQWIVEVWNGTELVLRQTGNTEQAFTITVTDLSANRSAAPAPAPAPAKRVTVTDSVPAPVAVGTKK